MTARPERPAAAARRAAIAVPRIFPGYLRGKYLQLVEAAGINPRPQVLDFSFYARSPFFVSHPSLPEGREDAGTSHGYLLTEPPVARWPAFL